MVEQVADHDMGGDDQQPATTAADVATGNATVWNFPDISDKIFEDFRKIGEQQGSVAYNFKLQANASTEHDNLIKELSSFSMPIPRNLIAKTQDKDYSGSVSYGMTDSEDSCAEKFAIPMAVYIWSGLAAALTVNRTMPELHKSVMTAMNTIARNRQYIIDAYNSQTPQLRFMLNGTSVDVTALLTKWKTLCSKKLMLTSINLIAFWKSCYVTKNDQCIGNGDNTKITSIGYSTNAKTTKVTPHNTKQAYIQAWIGILMRLRKMLRPQNMRPNKKNNIELDVTQEERARKKAENKNKNQPATLKNVGKNNKNKGQNKKPKGVLLVQETGTTLTNNSKGKIRKMKNLLSTMAIGQMSKSKYKIQKCIDMANEITQMLSAIQSDNEFRDMTGKLIVIINALIELSGQLVQENINEPVGFSQFVAPESIMMLLLAGTDGQYYTKSLLDRIRSIMQEGYTHTKVDFKTFEKDTTILMSAVRFRACCSQQFLASEGNKSKKRKRNSSDQMIPKKRVRVTYERTQTTKLQALIEKLGGANGNNVAKTSVYNELIKELATKSATFGTIMDEVELYTKDNVYDTDSWRHYTGQDPALI